MLSTFDIIMIIFIIVGIALAVYLLTRPKEPEKTPIQKLFDEALDVFGIKLRENLKQERFTVPRVFYTLDDIPKNMPTFIKYAFPKLDMNEVNTLLQQYGVNKTANQIFENNKDLTYDQFKNGDKFGDIQEIFYFYSYIIFEDTDINNVMDSLRLLIIIGLTLEGFKYKKSKNLPNNITDINYELQKDFSLQGDIKMYLVTNLNTNMNDNDTKLILESNDKETSNVQECLTTKLCNTKIKLEDDFEKQKKLAIANMTDFKRFFILGFVNGLFQLNGTSTPLPLVNEGKDLAMKLLPLIQAQSPTQPITQTTTQPTTQP
jgi:hypothetical protein